MSKTRDVILNHDIGEHTYGVPIILEWDDQTKLKIGKYCSIANDTIIILGGEHRTDWITTYPFDTFSLKGIPKTKGNVTIGNDVWIGYRVTILSGVTIGDGAVLGAGSIVTKDIEPYTIVAGNPAKEIRKRFDKKTIRRLLEEKWWEWDDEKVNENYNYLCNKPSL